MVRLLTFQKAPGREGRSEQIAVCTGALDRVLKAVKPGSKLGELCSLGDKTVLE